MYQLIFKQNIPQPREVVWKYISSPANLKKITPDYMGFDITNGTEEEMYPGMIIAYKVRPLLGISMTWVTEITHVSEGQYFVDEQRMGPYKLWHHQHKLEDTEQGVLMTDIVTYHPPFGLIGKIANRLFIRKQLDKIFDYRFKIMEEIFGS